MCTLVEISCGPPLATSALMSLGSVAPGWLLRSAASQPQRDRDTVLVVVQLTGGNDGLNTVVPYGDDEYGRSRTTLRLPTNELHKIDSSAGLSPANGSVHATLPGGLPEHRPGRGLPGLRTGTTIARCGSGIPPIRRSSGNSQRVGWAGWPTASGVQPRPDMPAVFVGPIARPFALNAENVVVPSHPLGGGSSFVVARWAVPAVTSAAHFEDPPAAQRTRRQYAAAIPARQHARRSRQERAGRVGDQGPRHRPSIRRSGWQDISAPSPSSSGPISASGSSSRNSAAAASAASTTTPTSSATTAPCCTSWRNRSPRSSRIFRRDKTLDRVLLMTFSEFGRTVRENGRRGTDHGDAGPVFLAGGKVQGGLVGSHPSLTDLDGGAPKSHTDFRRVYATVLDRWLGFESGPVLGSRFEPLDVLKA